MFILVPFFQAVISTQATATRHRKKSNDMVYSIASRHLLQSEICLFLCEIIPYQFTIFTLETLAVIDKSVFYFGGETRLWVLGLGQSPSPPFPWQYARLISQPPLNTWRMSIRPAL
jgi:hypothetical protein